MFRNNSTIGSSLYPKISGHSNAGKNRNAMGRSFNQSITGIANQSFNHSNIIVETSHHSIQNYGSVLPVLVIEAISCEGSAIGNVTVKISDFGWAWLVFGRRLFVWKFKSGTKNRASSSCYELHLPPSDLSHKADLIALTTNTWNEIPGVVGVSPEGIIRYWPNITYDGHSIETVAAELQGQECFSLTSIDRLGCILGTTTSSLVHILINNSDGSNLINCRTLKIPQGYLAGFGRKVSSFIFGALPSHSNETKSLIKVCQKTLDNGEETLLYVLASSVIQKWMISNSTNEKFFYEYDLDRPIRDSFLEHVWNRDNTHPDQLQIWFIDIIAMENDNILLLTAGLNAEVSNQLYYALILINDQKKTIDENSPLEFKAFTVLRTHTVCYSSEDEESLLTLKLLGQTNDKHFVYVFNRDKVLCVQLGHDVVDIVDFDRRNDAVLGAGVCDDVTLLFTLKDALVSLSPCHDLGFRHQKDVNVSEMSVLIGDGKPVQLKRSFLLYKAGDMKRCLEILSEIFPTVPGGDESKELDEAVISFSSEICNEIPRSDPRWAETENSTLSSTTTSVLLMKQLEDKLKSHNSFVEFLKNTGLWEKLSSYILNGAPFATQLLLGEHAEKIVAAITLKKLHNEFSVFLDPVMAYILCKRDISVSKRLTIQDVFYKEITDIDELIPALVEYENQQISSSLITSKDIFNMVISMSSIFVIVLQEICKFRQSQGIFYEALERNRQEYIPWSASLGPSGIRTSLFKHFEIVLRFGVDSKLSSTSSADDDVQIKSSFYQKMVDLIDVILDGYVCQLRSLGRGTDRFKVVERQYESDRSKLIKPLLNIKQYERATGLAEKYEDFDTLIRVCEQLDNKDRLNRYIREFEKKGFSEFLFKWYLKEGKQGKMLTTSSSALGNFLKDYENLQWLHQINVGDFKNSSRSLKILASTEKGYVSRKKTILSLSKLACLASGETDTSAIDTENELISYQESVPMGVVEDRNLDVDSMPPLTPYQLIEMYIMDHSGDSCEDDFKKALDLTRFMEHEEKELYEILDVRRKIFCAAILRDGWTEFNTDNAQDFIRETLFFRLISLTMKQHGDISEMLPSCDDILSSEELFDLSSNSSFVYLLKVAYELIEGILSHV